MLEHINAGLIGYGYAGQTLHAPLLNATPGIHLHSIVSRNGDKVRADWPDVQHKSDAEQLLADPDIDLVVIATPNDTHFPLAKAALQAGKHVVIDKPFTLDSKEARQLIALAHEHDLQLSVFHNRRWDADFLTLRQLITSGELGDILHLESHFDRYRPEVRDRWREQAVPGSGLWYDLGAHLLDQTLQLFGTPESLWLDLARQRPGARTDDFFHAVLQYGERRVILHASTQVVANASRFIVHGTLGSYSKVGLDTQEEQLKQGISPSDASFGLDPRPGRLITEQNGKQRIQDLSNQQGHYLAFYQGMADAIQRGTPAPVPAEDALKVMELIELGLRSAREGRRLVPGQLDTVIQSASRPASSHSAIARTPLTDTPKPRPLPLTNRPSHAVSSTAAMSNSAIADVKSTVSPSLQPQRQLRSEDRHASSTFNNEHRALAARNSADNMPRSGFRQPSPLDKTRLERRENPAPSAPISAASSRVSPSTSAPQGHAGSYRFGLTTGPGLNSVGSGQEKEPRIDLAHLTPEAERDEPQLGTPFPNPVRHREQTLSEPLLPEFAPTSLLASERQATPLRGGEPLPHLSVRDDDEDEDLPPFSAS